MQAYHISVVVW